MITKELIIFDDFTAMANKLDIRIGQVVSVDRVPKSTKMLKMQVIFGEDEEDERTVLTNLGGTFTEDDLLGLTFPFVVNLAPTKIMGIESQAMILVTSFEDKVPFLEFNRIGSSLI